MSPLPPPAMTWHYLDSDGGRAVHTLCRGVGTWRRAQVLTRYTAAVEGGEDGYGRPGGAADGERVVLTGMSRVIPQNPVQVSWGGSSPMCTGRQNDTSASY